MSRMSERKRKTDEIDYIEYLLMSNLIAIKVAKPMGFSLIRFALSRYQFSA